MGVLTVRGSLAVIGLSVCAILLGLNHIQKNHERKARDVLVVNRAEKPKFTFDDIYNSNFAYKSFSVRWVSGNEYIYMDGDQNIMKTNVEGIEGNAEELMAGTVYTSANAASYKVSADQKFIALLTDYKKGWRHTYNGTYLIYDVDAGTLRDGWKTPADTQYFTWSSSGNASAYVNGFNIFYRPTVDAASVQVTFDGRANYIYNGIPDWVYEEEMISSNNVMYFSPDGQYLAFAQFNDSGCQHINFERYDGGLYPNMLDVSYPKAGTTQPTNKVFIYNTVNNMMKEIDPPTEFVGNEYLFNRVTWASENRAAVAWCDRIQTKSMMRMVNVNASVFTLDYEDHANYNHASSAWLHQRRPYWIPVFGQTTDVFYTVRPNGNWQHLHRVSKDEKTPLTSGDYTVTSESAAYPSVEIYDNATGRIYFSATKESPQHRHIYRASANPAEPDCITCKYAQDYQGRCDYISTQFSTDGSHVIIRCGGDGVPMYIQAKLDHTATDPSMVLTDESVIEDNEDLATNVNATDMSTKEYGTFSSKTGYDFTYQIWKPPNFDPTKKYPLLIDVYAGPGYQRVYAAWSRGWHTRFLPSSLDVVVASVDGRGANFYGEDLMHEVYRKLGQYEPLDQLEFAKYMANMDWIDETRIAAWGWSYGGYATSLILGNDGADGSDKIIKCGFAVAPLVDWRFYDTIYSERYMSLPTEADNKDGYDKARVLPLAKNFKQSAYYLIHGTADDNVHFQNAARIERELVANDIDFNDFFYADQDHSINSGNARKHVYKVLTRQVCQCFGLEVPDGMWST